MWWVLKKEYCDRVGYCFLAIASPLKVYNEAYGMP